MFLMYGDLKILTGTANPQLAMDICDHLGCSLTPALCTTFSDGELLKFSMAALKQTKGQLTQAQTKLEAAHAKERRGSVAWQTIAVVSKTTSDTTSIAATAPIYENPPSTAEPRLAIFRAVILPSPP